MLAKIKWFQVAIILVVLTMLAVAGIFLGLIKPVNERYDAASSTYTSQKQTKEDAERSLPGAKQDTVKATQEVALAKSSWAKYDRALMPDIDLRNRFTATKQLWNEQLKVLGPKVLKFLYGDRTVRVLDEKIAIAQPSGDPNYVATQKMIAYPLGNITVSGTIEPVLKHTERWNKFDRLALVDGLVLAGNSPTLTGTYNVTIFEILHYDDGVGPVIPQAGTTNGTGGGFPGGGGYPGAPMGGGPGGPMMSGGAAGGPMMSGGSAGGPMMSGGAPAGAPGAPAEGDPNGVR